MNDQRQILSWCEIGIDILSTTVYFEHVGVLMSTEVLDEGFTNTADETVAVLCDNNERQRAEIDRLSVEFFRLICSRQMKGREQPKAPVYQPTHWWYHSSSPTKHVYIRWA
jgi:hypothetical protein